MITIIKEQREYFCFDFLIKRILLLINFIKISSK